MGGGGHQRGEKKKAMKKAYIGSTGIENQIWFFASFLLAFSQLPF